MRTGIIISCSFIISKHNTKPASERSSEVSSCSCWHGAGNQTECKNNQTSTPPTLISVTSCAAADKVHYSEVWRLNTFWPMKFHPTHHATGWRREKYAAHREMAHVLEQEACANASQQSFCFVFCAKMSQEVHTLSDRFPLIYHEGWSVRSWDPPESETHPPSPTHLTLSRTTVNIQIMNSLG